MIKIKKMPLSWWMTYEEHEDILNIGYEEVPQDTIWLFHTDGQYYDRWSKTWWFEVNDRAYRKPGHESYFLYTLAISDWEILSRRETDAMQTVLNLTRDPLLKQALNRRMQQHLDAWQLRDTARMAKKAAIQFEKRCINC